MRVSNKALNDGLHLPEGTMLIGCEWDFHNQQVVLYIAHDDFPDLHESQLVPDILAYYTIGPDGRPTFERWEMR